MALKIWCNSEFTEAARQALVEGTRAHELVWAAARSSNVLQAGKPDPLVGQVDILLGQPAPGDCLQYRNVRWVEVTTAGYTRYDTPELKETFQARGAVFTTASEVFADPCAQHVLAMMLALGRNILPSYHDQLTDHSWHYEKRRYDSMLLTGQTVLMLGYGAIGRRLAQLLAPFGMKLYAVRRRVHSVPGVRIIAEDSLSSVLAEADHIVNILPDSESTRGYVNARRLACCKRAARFYNVGRGTTVDEPALLEALESGRLGAAYLDVFAAEPLAPDHPFWTARNCFVTPHTAGGRRDQDEAIVRHFLANLRVFEHGGDWLDRVV